MGRFTEKEGKNSRVDWSVAFKATKETNRYLWSDIEKEFATYPPCHTDRILKIELYAKLLPPAKIYFLETFIIQTVKWGAACSQQVFETVKSKEKRG